MPKDWGGAANLDAYCHGNNASLDARSGRPRRPQRPRPKGDHANVTNSDPYDGPHYGQPFPGRARSAPAGRRSARRARSRSAALRPRRVSDAASQTAISRRPTTRRRESSRASTASSTSWASTVRSRRSSARLHIPGCSSRLRCARPSRREVPSSSEGRAAWSRVAIALCSRRRLRA